MSNDNVYKINKMDVQSLSMEEINKIFLEDGLMTKKYGLLKRFRNVDEYKNAYLSNLISNNNSLFLLNKDEKIVGLLTFIKSFDWGGNEQYKLTIKLCDEIIGIPLTNCLRQFIQEKLDIHKQIAIVVYGNECDELVKELTAKVQLKGNNYTLAKTDIDIDILKKTAESLQAKNSDLRMVYTDVVPEEYVEKYCDLFNDIQETMPDVTEDGFVQYVESPEKLRTRIKANAEHGRTHHCIMIFAENGDMIAQSNVISNNNDPRFPYQFLVGVSSQYWGRQLGKWLYAVMYQKLYETIDFEKVHMVHHPSNKHIIAISEWVGYKFSVLETTYVVENN